MAINIEVNVKRALASVNNKGLTLVIFKNAREDEGASTEPVRINTVEELYEAFGGATHDSPTLEEKRELYSAEYLIRAGVNLLCYSTTTVGTIAAGDITNIEDVELLDYKLIVVPYNFISFTAGAPVDLQTELVSFVKSADVQLFMDLDQFIDDADVTSIKGHVDFTDNASAKLEFFIGAGLPNFTSNYSGLSEFIITTPGEYTEASDFVGIPASLAAVARKAKALNSNKPWLAVAGYENGNVVELNELLRNFSRTAKEELQAHNVNVLLMRVGIGNIIVSQNTMYITEDDSSPLIRSHAVTTALWCKREFEKVSWRFKANPNTQKTWELVELALNKILDYARDAEGIEQYDVSVGRGKTMTEQDITNGLLKVAVSILPIRVIENINIVLSLQTSEDTYDIIIEGGDL